LTTGGPGWFPDPLGHHQHRYFRGDRWTEHVADNGVVGIEPLRGPAAAPAAASWFSGAQRNPPSNRLRALLATVVLLVGILTFVLIAKQPTGSNAAGQAAPPAAVAGARATSPTEKARTALLVLSDLPKGWTSTKSQNNNSPFPGAAQLAGCLGVPTSVITSQPPTAYSPEFASKDQRQLVSDSVSVYPSARAAQADFASLANPKTPSCLTTVLNNQAKAALGSGFGTGTSLGTVTVTRAPATEFAPHNANFTALVPVTDQGATLNLQLTVVDFVRGTEEQTVTLVAVQGPFPTALARQLTTVAAGRIYLAG